MAIVSNTGLGDALWMAVIATNFIRHGHSVTLFSDFLTHFQELFPSFTVKPYPEMDRWDDLYREHDQLLIQQFTPLSKKKDLPPHAFVLRKESLDPTKSYVSNLQNFCQIQLNLPSSGTEVEIQIPSNWVYRAHPKRVVIHPSSANAWKNWPIQKFIKLAKKLRNKGFNPCITLPEDEAVIWRPLLQQAGLDEPVCISLLELGKFIYESGYLIGNDASAGHLASSLHIPTVTIFDRKSRAIFWRPGWGPGKVVLPYPILPGRSMRKAFWKHFLPVGRVYRVFAKLAT